MEWRSEGTGHQGLPETKGYYTLSERHANVDDSQLVPLRQLVALRTLRPCSSASVTQKGIAARVAVGYAVDNRMRGSGSAIVIMGDRAYMARNSRSRHRLDAFDIYPQQSDEPPPQVVAQSLESLLGEIARDDPTVAVPMIPNMPGSFSRLTVFWLEATFGRTRDFAD